MTEGYERLRKFISSDMRMSHVYQPVMIQTPLEHGGRATVGAMAAALLAKDAAQIAYYEAAISLFFGGADRGWGETDQPSSEA